MKNRISQIIIANVLLSFHVFCGAGASQTPPISGQVVDYMAKPVESAEIAILEYVSEYPDYEYTAKVIAPFVKTDENGCFQVQTDISSQNSIFAVARKTGFAYAWDRLNYSSNIKEKGEFLLVLEKANTLTGKVVDFQGNAVSGATVQAIPKTSYMRRLDQRPIYGPKEWFTTETDSDGLFTFEYFSEDVCTDFYVEAPNWNCTYKYTTHYQNSSGFEVWRDDIELILPQEGKVKGRVVETGTDKAVGGLGLIIQAERDTEDIRNRYFSVKIVTDSDGSFVCDGLPEGNNRIELSENNTQADGWIAEAVKFSITPDQTTENVQIEVQKGGIIEYLVRQYNTEQLLSGINISSYNTDFRVIAKTNEQGLARARVLPGEYQAYGSGDGYVTWRVNVPVIVKEGEVTNIEMELEKSPVISGTVVDANDQPAEDIMVTVHPFGDHVYTDNEGNFVAGYDESRKDNGVYIIARDTKNSLAAVVHTKDFNKSMKLTLSPALDVQGKIADSNGTGIAAARISPHIAYTYCLSDLGEEVVTDDKGVFEFRGIPLKPDDYDYRFSIHSTGFAPKTYYRINIEAEPGSIADVGTIELKPTNLSVSGYVVDANGLPKPQAIIFVNGLVGSEQPQKCTATNQQGQFAIKGVSSDPIRLQANFASDPGGAGFTRATGGDQDIKIVLGQELEHISTPQPESSTGKILPDMSELGIELSNVEDKKILVCFFDYQQRPSRNAVLQLSTRAEELKAQDIEIIAIQASSIEQAMLDNWVKENNITFPVGLIENDEEQIKLDWGVQSLPWLILTDAEHTVTAEGFAIAKLDEKIQETDNAEK